MPPVQSTIQQSDEVVKVHKAVLQGSYQSYRIEMLRSNIRLCSLLGSDFSIFSLTNTAKHEITPLVIIDFACLLPHEALRLNRLLAACQTYADFYLELQGVMSKCS